MFACMASHKSAEPNTLVVLVGFDQRDALIASDPETYYLKDHYLNYPSVLARLSRIRPDALRDLLLKAWRFTVSRHKSPARRQQQKKKPSQRTRALRNRTVVELAGVMVAGAGMRSSPPFARR